MYKLKDVNIGDSVVVSITGGTRSGTVVEVDEDIKNGMPGISYDTASGEGFWCYLDQITQVIPQVKKAEKKTLSMAKGDNVIVKTSTGTIEGIVQSIESDVKNGIPGITFTHDGKNHWCYKDQVVSFTKPVKKPKAKM